MLQRRRTKIIATLGPATDQPGMLEKILHAGVDLVRLNFSHGKTADHEARVKAVRECGLMLGREIGIIADLQGPKIRVARFKEGKVNLTVGAAFVLDASYDSNAGNESIVGIDYKELPHDVKSHDVLLLDDGRVVLKVEFVDGSQIRCRVMVGGILSNNKGINRLGGGLSAKALTEKDKADLITAVALEVDYIAISFPRNANDIEEAKKLISEAGGTAGVIAKIERAEAIEPEVLDDIIEASAAVMVARGDLGVEIGDATLPAVQKRIIHRARTLNRAVITATQMMETMIHHAIPTRAEVFDVANAVLDGTDAVMLSAETASGDHPDIVVESMARICLMAERDPNTQISRHRVECAFSKADEAVAMATMYTANHLDTAAIIALTESGLTPLWMSRIRSGIPIFGLSRRLQTERKMTLYRGVYPLPFDVTQVERGKLYEAAMAVVEKHGFVKSGDWVIITHGDQLGSTGGTNTMKLLQVS
ncbi:MAG: pyruvate kinase [Legionellales bacterium]|nr:pyruvate kinase [Legionellales bacterium]